MRPHPRRARTNSRQPSAWATDDRTGFVCNLRDLQWQHQWAGTQLVNQRVLVHPDFLDKPQPQLRTIIIPPDPATVQNARPEPYSIDEAQDVRVTMDGSVRILMGHGTGYVNLRVTIGD